MKAGDIFTSENVRAIDSQEDWIIAETLYKCLKQA
jgi:hypothetical protein